MTPQTLCLCVLVTTNLESTLLLGSLVSHTHWIIAGEKHSRENWYHYKSIITNLKWALNTAQQSRQFLLTNWPPHFSIFFKTGMMPMQPAPPMHNQPASSHPSQRKLKPLEKSPAIFHHQLHKPTCHFRIVTSHPAAPHPSGTSLHLGPLMWCLKLPW